MTPRTVRVLLALGVVGIVVGLAWYHAAELAVPAYATAGTSRFPWTLGFAGLLVIAVYGTGLPDVVRSRWGAALNASAAYGASAGALSLAQLVAGQPLLPRAVVFGTGILLVPYATMCSGLLIDARAKAAGHDRVVVVGDWADAASLSYELEHGAERQAQIVDVLTPAEAAATRSGELPLRQMVLDSDADVVVLDRVAQLDRTIVDQVAALHEAGVRVRTLSLFSEEWLGKLPISELERVSLMFDIGEVHRVRYGRCKRVIDIVLASAGSVALGAALPFVLAGNACGNRGPLFYRQVRVGKNGRIITIVKFRTMRPDPGAASDWTAAGDPRITPFGSWLRRTHLDELPQVLNILRGDLSITGPRPEQPQYVQELSEKLPFYPLRHLVRPGLTGWAQVKYGYAANESDALEKLQYEFYYLRHQRLSLDLRIVARTWRSILRRDGT